MAVAAQGNPAFTTMIAQGFGAGVGRVLHIMNKETGIAAVRSRCCSSPGFTAAEPGAAHVSARHLAGRVDSRVEGVRPRPAVAICRLVKGAATSSCQRHHESSGWTTRHLCRPDAGPTGGAMIQREPNDPAWYKGGLWHDNMKINIPGFWFMSWYDVSVGPNLAAYNHVRKTASPEIANQQYAVIAPTLHCAFKRATENTMVGERSVGDARLNYDELTYAWFDHFLKGENNGILEKMPTRALLHDGHQQVADLRHVAATRRAANELFPFERRQSKHAQRRWRALEQRPRRIILINLNTIR